MNGCAHKSTQPVIAPFEESVHVISPQALTCGDNASQAVSEALLCANSLTVHSQAVCSRKAISASAAGLERPETGA